MGHGGADRSLRDGVRGNDDQSLLEEMVATGFLSARTKWADIFPLIKDDRRFLNMLGQGGYVRGERAMA